MIINLEERRSQKQTIIDTIKSMKRNARKQWKETGKYPTINADSICNEIQSTGVLIEKSIVESILYSIMALDC